MTAQSLSERDTQFFAEVYHLIKDKYPEMEEKFGLWRIHQHFDLKEDEVFHETSDPYSRESILRIIKGNDLPQQAFASTWKLTESGPVVATWCCEDDRRIG